MGFKFDGFDELENTLSQLEKKSKELDGTHEIALDDLFTSSFMRKHTSFSSFDEFLEAGKFIVNSQEDFEAISEHEMDLHVEETTSFSSWDDMYGEATEEYILDKLGFR